MITKTNKIYTILAGVLMFAIPAGAGTVDINWKNTDDYKDVSIGTPGDESVDRIKEEINPYIERLAEKQLPDGSVLVMNITNFDLAGEFEPWRVNYDVRIVRDIYPPSMTFSYKLVRDGEVLEEGKETLSDIGFTYNIGRRFFDDDQFFYEKEMISDWIRDEFEDYQSS